MVDPKVTTAVEFLNDVKGKRYAEADLRKYLVHKRSLTQEQVDEAFVIHRQKMKEERSGGGSAPLNITSPRRAVIKRASPVTSPKNTQSRSSISGTEERNIIETTAGKPAQKATSSGEENTTNSDILGFLKKDMKIKGGKLIKDFLKTEWNYCTILECLKQEYYKHLVDLADKKKIKMTRKELEEIFRRVPELLKFHKVFYMDLNRGSNIGRMFVKLFNFFKGYVEYMKDCAGTVDKMRDYTRDKRLHKHLTTLRGKSSRQKDDMVDLLLVPLDRIMDYKEFLDHLYEWADTTHEDYETLGKASRRIGRVAKYIEKYKYGIRNRNEMNKVQQFLGKQCDIIAPHRRIIRRGMMIRRTTGMLARNKQYIFFLFNDVLLWATKKRELQNVVQLRNCEIMPSDQKNDSQKKFTVVSRSQRHKTLLLECLNKKQRDEWFHAIEDGIKVAKDASKQPTTANGQKKPGHTRRDSAAVINWKNSGGVAGKADNEVLPNKPVTLNVEEEKDDDDAATGSPKSPGDDDYTYENTEFFKQTQFKNQEFRGTFDPMDDTISQISEHDSRDIGGYYDPVSNASTLAFLNPHRSDKIKNQGRSSSEANITPINDDPDGYDQNIAEPPKRGMVRSNTAGNPVKQKRGSLPLNALRNFDGAYDSFASSGPGDVQFRVSDPQTAPVIERTTASSQNKPMVSYKEYRRMSAQLQSDKINEFTKRRDELATGPEPYSPGRSVIRRVGKASNNSSISNSSYKSSTGDEPRPKGKSVSISLGDF